jgi:glucan 1,3-beta-glucosidase
LLILLLTGVVVNRPQWSYKKGLAAGVLPAKAYERSFDCDLSKIPSFSDLPETF